MSPIIGVKPSLIMILGKVLCMCGTMMNANAKTVQLAAAVVRHTAVGTVGAEKVVKSFLARSIAVQKLRDAAFSGAVLPSFSAT